MDYKQFINMLANFQITAFNLGFKVGQNGPTAEIRDLGIEVNEMFHNIIDYIKTNTKEN